MLGALCLATALTVACATSDPAGGTAGGPAVSNPSGGALLTPPFDDVTAEVGIDFVHFNGMTGEKYIAEMMGPGGALADFDGDGDLDLWLRQGMLLGAGKTMADALFPPGGPAAPSDRLYRNDLAIAADGSRRLHFTDVTAETGVEITGYGMGAATGDFDNDGRIDLYLTNLGPNRMLRNLGDLRFDDVTGRSGTNDDRWSVPAVFVDIDRDGLLDLWVGNYVDFSLANHKQCFRPNSAADYCGPLSFLPQPDRMFRNRGDGKYEDVTASSGMAGGYGNSLGVLVADFDADGRIDLFVANDAQENHLWINRADGTFVEDGLLRGVAVNGRGEREGSMGVSTGDFDADGSPDIFVTHMATETNTLYVNDGKATFSDGTMTAGLATASRSRTGFGTSWIDYDNDGRLDLFVVNGAVKVVETLELQGDLFPLSERNQLFHNEDGGRFADVSERAGSAFEIAEVGRGAIFGDVDNDGDTDVVVVNNNGPVRLLLNTVGQDAHWLGVELRDRHGRAAQGARVTALRNDAAPQVRWAGTDGSYCSANDPRVRFGFGIADRGPTAVRVDWPSGLAESFAIEVIDDYVELTEGDGTPRSQP